MFGPFHGGNQEEKEDEAAAFSKVGLYKKIVAVMSELDALPRERINDGIAVPYSAEKVIKEKLRPLLIKYQLVFKLETIKHSHSSPKLTCASFRYAFIDAETGASMGGLFEGDGHDTQDRGIWKAMTGAFKYIMASHFFIVTGQDDPEFPSRPLIPASGTRSAGAPGPYSANTRGTKAPGLRNR